MAVDRRRFLRLGVIVVGALAGCTQAPDEGDDGSDGTQNTPQSTPTASSTPAPTSTSTRANGGSEHTVTLTDDLTYEPTSLTVSRGDTVVWENEDSVVHTVTAYEMKIPDGSQYFASGGFKSESAARDGFPDGSISGGETYEYTFETNGAYEYFCIPHEQAEMIGSVTVQ